MIYTNSSEMFCRLQVVSIRKKTTAKLFKDVHVGDVLRFSLPLSGPGRVTRGCRASYMQVVNENTGESTKISMNNFDRIRDSIEYTDNIDNILCEMNNIEPKNADKMVFLSLLKKAEYLCLNHDNYSVAIFVQDINESVATFFRQYVIRGEKRISRYHIEILFENGSIIRIIPASDNARGCKAYFCIVDKDISPNICRCNIFPIIIPYHDRDTENKSINRDSSISYPYIINMEYLKNYNTME